MKNYNESIWAESYRPTSVSDIILPQDTKALLQSYVKAGDISNHLLFAGKPGMGKTTAARALANDLGADSIIIPASIQNGIDTLRDTMVSFASTVSFTDAKRKILILDEADHLNQKSVMPALRNFMDEYGHNCALIMTANYKSRIIDPLISRLTVIDFTIPKEEKPKLAIAFLKRTMAILDNEGVAYHKDAIVEVIKKRFPDWRATLNHLQSVANSSEDNFITVEKARNFHGQLFSELLTFIQKKSYSESRKWLGENTDIDTETFYRVIFETIFDICADEGSKAICAKVIADHLYQEAFVADTEINRASLVATLMMEGSFK